MFKMDSLIFFYSLYALLGTMFLLLNKRLATWGYKLSLLYTSKLSLQEVFIFKLDARNKNSMFTLMRTFTISFGLMLISLSLYMMDF